jgi:hypothetical protein
MYSSGALAKSGGKRACFAVLHGFGAGKSAWVWCLNTHGLLGFRRDVYCPSLERLAAFLSIKEVSCLLCGAQLT